MSAIVTDQLRILNAKNFISEITSVNNSYYTFVGLTNPEEYISSWDENPPAPKDNFDQENHNWDTIIGLKKVDNNNVKFALKKNTWTSGINYDMYRHDINRDKLSQPSLATSLYSSNFYVVNRDFKVYVCLHNGTDPENPTGRPSLDEPTFIDLEPRSAGSSGDGYIWKYMFTISPSDIIKFDTLDYIAVPTDWFTADEYSSVRLNATNSGQLKISTIKTRGVDVGSPNEIYVCDIVGDGTGGEATIVVDNQSKVDSVTISNGGNGYTYANIDLSSGNFPTSPTTPTFDVIIPPKGGHGADIYRELGCTKVLIYSQIKNDATNPDFIVGNRVARIGMIANPENFNSSEPLEKNQASALYALKLTGVNASNDYINAIFQPNATITQTVSTGSTAVGRVVSYNKNTGVLKYWQDRISHGFDSNLVNTDIVGIYGNDLIQFSATTGTGGSLNISGSNQDLKIDDTFSDDKLVINNLSYYLGQTFTKGVSTPEVKKYSGDLVYVDNRPSITRSENQREDIKIVLQF